MPHQDIMPTMLTGHSKDSYIVPVSFALRGREGGAMPEVSDGGVSALRSASGGSSRDYVAFDTTQISSAAIDDLGRVDCVEHPRKVASFVQGLAERLYLLA